MRHSTMRTSIQVAMMEKFPVGSVVEAWGRFPKGDGWGGRLIIKHDDGLWYTSVRPGRDGRTSEQEIALGDTWLVTIYEVHIPTPQISGNTDSEGDKP